MFFVATGALAQISINVVNEQSLPRLDKDGATVIKRPQTLTPEGVSLQDCIDDQKIRFTLQMSGFEARSIIQAWASIGQDCKPTQARNTAQAVCWPLLDSAIPLSPVTNVDIPVRKIMSGAPPFKPLEPVATEEACGKIDLANIGVHFLYFAPGDPTTAQSAKSVTVTVDTVGPDPPSGLRVLPGNTRIIVNWTNISGGAAGDAGAATGGLTELTGVKVYCDVAGAAAPAADAEPATDAATEQVCRDEPVDAGLDADAAVDGGTVEIICEDVDAAPPTPTAPECSSDNFANDDGSPLFPTKAFDDKYKCGEASGNTGSQVIARKMGSAPLVNGTRYAVAVAATDRFGNVGLLSDVVCEAPELTTDFWDEYRRAGGSAGGCATNGAEAPIGTVTTMLIGAALAISIVRRRSTR